MEITHDENIRAALAAATPKTLGVSPSYASRLKNGLRPLTVELAERLGFDVVTSYIPAAPPPEPADEGAEA